MADWLADLASWAWARHHNVLSWYVRPLFFLPFCYFAYKRSLFGMVLTLVALATSMAWFPATDTEPAPPAVAAAGIGRVVSTGPAELGGRLDEYTAVLHELGRPGLIGEAIGVDNRADG